MVTKVDVYSSIPDFPDLELPAPVLPLSASVFAGDDFLQVISIDGLDPVTAAFSKSSLATVDGETVTNTQVPSRNIVLTLNPNPDWNTWTHEKLRDLIYVYFAPKKAVKLVFDSDELGSVQISGIVESVSANMFTKDPPYVVSIICADPYFLSVEPVEYSAHTIRSGGVFTAIVNAGNVETPFYLKVASLNEYVPAEIRVQMGDPQIVFFEVAASVDANRYFDMSTKPRFKFVREVDLTLSTVNNRMAGITDGSTWFMLPPGPSQFAVLTAAEDQMWYLSFYKRFAGI